MKNEIWIRSHLRTTFADCTQMLQLLCIMQSAIRSDRCPHTSSYNDSDGVHNDVDDATVPVAQLHQINPTSHWLTIACFSAVTSLKFVRRVQWSIVSQLA